MTTERILSKEQTAEMGYLRGVLGVTLREKEHRSEIHKAQDVKPLPRFRAVARKSSIGGLYICVGVFTFEQGGLTLRFDKYSTDL